MPNGGSDCCGTCLFNDKNKGEVGYEHTHDPEPDFCNIRGFSIQSPFYTYCGNHPHHNQSLVNLPIGPVWHAIGSESPREILLESQDDETIRQRLLSLLKNIGNENSVEYVSGAGFYETVINQLTSLDEKRAIPELERISNLKAEPMKEFPQAIRGGLWERPRQLTIDLAKKALIELQKNST